VGLHNVHGPSLIVEWHARVAVQSKLAIAIHLADFAAKMARKNFRFSLMTKMASLFFRTTKRKNKSYLDVEIESVFSTDAFCRNHFERH
jgi:hypothetical protein